MSGLPVSMSAPWSETKLLLLPVYPTNPIAWHLPGAHPQGEDYSMAKIVLVVDDHEIVRKMVCSMFIAQGFEVHYAENGARAVEKAQELHPHLVVLDLAMPVMDGLEAARKLKMLMPSLPLLMFTNNVGAILEQEARAAGIAAVISKSGSAELLAKAKALLSGVKGAGVG